MPFDVIIIGAGPSGLCMARALSGQGLRIAIIEQQTLAELEQPAFDGREIALTQRSANALKNLGVWPLLESTAISALSDAKIMDGTAAFELLIQHNLTAHTELGWLVSNHLLRQAAFEAVQDAMTTHEDILIFAGDKLAHLNTDTNEAQVRLASGLHLQSKLIIAADNRFSSARRMMGIAADMHDFGRTMLVCCMTHDEPHHHIAWEWFAYGQTLAVLPMNPDPMTQMHRSSIVVTMLNHATESLMNCTPEEFALAMQCRFSGRLGNMRLASTRHAYPLVSVYPRRLVANRFACIGDAAIGMHPVTAHGFNFGLLGVQALSKQIIEAVKMNKDIASVGLLERYEKTHRLKTRPLYLLTRLITDIYTAESLPAKLLRKALLTFGQHALPFKKLLAGSLTGS